MERDSFQKKKRGSEIFIGFHESTAKSFAEFLLNKKEYNDRPQKEYYNSTKTMTTAVQGGDLLLLMIYETIFKYKS